MALFPLVTTIAKDLFNGVFHGIFWVPVVACLGGIIRGTLRSTVISFVLIFFENRFQFENRGQRDLFNRGMDWIACVLGEFVPSFILARIFPDVGPCLDIMVAPDPSTSETCAFVVVFTIMCVQQSLQEMQYRLDLRYAMTWNKLEAIRNQMRTHPGEWEVNDGYRGLNHHTPEELNRLMDRRRKRALEKVKRIQRQLVLLNLAYCCAWEMNIFLAHCIHDRVRTRWPNQIWDLPVLPKSVRMQLPEDTTVLGRSAYWVLHGLLAARNYLRLSYDGFDSNVHDLVVAPLMMTLHWDAMEGQKQALGGRVFYGKKLNPAHKHKRTI
ncbi:hypothetical protein SODALDRAFT_330944 [Sodiomyces alkalinus F11]|uniref:Uncharacterized protein n=1 Tax=Sodiomyces alkalinus (strain CBS 110278 / VKM F-3762 / F11) TaxID=1314773 RepID=A0A3N2Q3L9_SODAK|nr:hypothetical protein SODALDRAFT_330944 [Sodiomyces alkalinus F11]ROT41225.1 hypothetical protein SODALDRAFT_330944 [Sodiomyces alkalinus F11]